MKRFIIMMVMMLSVSVANAGGDTYINTTRLSETQKAELAVQVAKIKEANRITPVATVEEVKKYSELVTAIGSGVKDTAVQLGVAANDFVKTPVGMMTAGLIAWNYVGKTILGVIIGSIWFIIMLPLWIYFYRRMVIINSIQYFDKGAREDGKRKVVTYADKYDTKISGEAHFMLWIALIAICGTGFIVIFA